MNQCRFDEALVQDAPEWRGLRSRRWTYAETVGRTPWLLLDNDADPWQLDNLVDVPSHEEIQRSLAIELRRRLDAVNDPFADTLGMVEHTGTLEAWRDRDLDMMSRYEELFGVAGG